MTGSPCLIAVGRSAEIYGVSDRRVLRRYHNSSYDTSQEVAVMKAVREQGFPTPVVYEASGPNMVLERIDGPTMLEDLVRAPWRMQAHSSTLAALHDHLHSLRPPGEIPCRFGEGEAVVHLDLHPGNVLMAPSGPVVIDWTNACRGPAGLDLAHTWLLLSVGVPPGGPIAQFAARVGGRALAGMFRRSVDRVQLGQWLVAAANDRVEDEHMLPGEIASIRKLARSARTR